MSGQDSEQALGEHPAYAPRLNAWQTFSEALIRLIGTDRPSVVARELRCSDQNVRDWRRRGVVPGWALITVRVRLEELGASVERAAGRLALVKPGPGKGTAPNIQAWNQRRFAKSGDPAK